MSRTRVLVDRLLARDPGLKTVHRAVRVSLAACAGFYSCRYGLGQPVAGTYALFGAIAIGVLSRIGGGSRARVRTLLLVLPATWVLVSLGTLLAVRTWAAALGMLAVGFAVAFATVGGPRLVGLANGLQLFYILPCFPPYAPDDLPQRLAGVTLGIVLPAVAELLLWPAPPPVDYRDRLARAGAAVAALADRTAARCESPTARLAAAGPDPSAEPMAELRLSRIPLLERPASAGATDRALTQAATALRHTRTQLLRIGRFADRAGPDPEAATLLHATADAVRKSAAGVRPGLPAPAVPPIEAAVAAFEEQRAAAVHPFTAPDGRDPVQDRAAARLALGSIALEAAEGARFLALAVRISRHAPVPPDRTPPAERPGPFWYAGRPAARLWWSRFRYNLTPRSVYFQNALRTAAALAAARTVAGSLDLAHGFWVLLATLTLMRTTAADIRMTLRPALTGTLCGAAATAAMLVLVGDRNLFYAVTLPVAMLVAFTVGPLLGLAWAQGTFTVVIAMVFAQLAPAGWRLAETRLLDVATGAAVGTLAGLCAWPRGGGRELRRRTAELLADSAAAIRETVAVLTGAPASGGALRRARVTAVLTEATYAQYRSEHHDTPPDGPDWQAAQLAGLHTVRGAEQLLARIAPESLAPWPDTSASLARDADRAAAAFRGQGAALLAGRPAGPADPLLAEARTVLTDERTTATRLPADPAALHTVDLAVWLGGVIDDLAAVAAPAADAAPSGAAVSPPGRPSAPPGRRPAVPPDGTGPPRSPR
ncbi:FUSC family protein [Kitasatospora sp. KL5]|uniref:FUSC family protein n=1 Tax=Kitasatospora sp. KL5 TaxID=3425125 RepID=UPI003D6DD533